MLRKLLAGTAALAAIPLLLSACGDDTAGPGTASSGDPGTFRGVADAGAGAFEIHTEPAPDGFARGFLLRGENIRYDDDAHALLVDFTVVNDTPMSQPEPVVLTFLQLQPPGVTVDDSDNGETGPGAQVRFEFEDGDDVWSEGEASLPRTVSFGVDPGVAVAFVARIDVGLAPGSGVIGGMLWHDADADGEIDSEETGLAGLDVILAQDGREIRRATSRADGQYGFRGLPAGIYVVRPARVEGLSLTTAPSLTIVLPEMANFLSANFGFRRADGGGGDGTIRVGDRVNAQGMFDADPARLVAWRIEVGENVGDDHEDVLVAPWGSLRGPATDVDLENGVLFLMGTPVAVEPGDGDRAMDGGGEHGCPHPDLEHVRAGDRLRVEPSHRVPMGDEEILAAPRMQCWLGHGDRVKGVVQRLRFDGEVLRAIRVLDTWVEITGETTIEHHDCEDDRGDDD